MSHNSEFRSRCARALGKCLSLAEQSRAPGKSAEERKLNARLAVSCARKAGCMVFLLWEDIVECKPKMLLVLFATLMQLEMSATDSPSMPSARQISDVV